MVECLGTLAENSVTSLKKGDAVVVLGALTGGQGLRGRDAPGFSRGEEESPGSS